MFRVSLFVLSTAAIVATALGDETVSVVVNDSVMLTPIKVGEHQVMHIVDFVQASPTATPTVIPAPTVVVIVLTSPTPTPTATPVATIAPSPVPRGHIIVNIEGSDPIAVYQAEFEQSVQTQRNCRIAGPATVRVMVECTNAGCVSGRLRTYLFNCTSGLTVVLRTDFGAALTSGTAFLVDLHVSAPVSGCLQASIDSSGGVGTSSVTPQIAAPVLHMSQCFLSGGAACLESAVCWRPVVCELWLPNAMPPRSFRVR